MPRGSGQWPQPRGASGHAAVRVEDCDGAVERWTDAAPLLRGVDAQVARQGAATHGGAQVDGVVVGQAVGGAAVETQVLEPMVGAVTHLQP